MTASNFPKAMPQDAVQLMQLTGTRAGWLAFPTQCKQLATLFSRSSFSALTLGDCKPCSDMVSRGSGMILTIVLAQLLCKVPGNARTNGGSGSCPGLLLHK